MFQKVKGCGLIASAATLWAFTGIAMEYIYNISELTPVWLTFVRMFIAGVILLITAFFRYKNIFRLFHKKKDFLIFLFYAVFGNLFVQYSYLKAIQCSDASTATMLQFVSPVMVLGVCAVQNRKFPSSKSILFALLSITGIVFISTKGDFSKLAISSEALFWGIISAVSLCITTVVPVNLCKEYGSETVLGWAMILGGLIYGIIFRPYNYDVEVTPILWGLIILTAIIGTSVSFIFYFNGIKIVGAACAGVIGTLEVAVSAGFSAILFNNIFTGWDSVGMIFIIISTVGLTLTDRKKRPE